MTIAFQVAQEDFNVRVFLFRNGHRVQKGTLVTAVKLWGKCLGSGNANSCFLGTLALLNW